MPDERVVAMNPMTGEVEANFAVADDRYTAWRLMENADRTVMSYASPPELPER